MATDYIPTAHEAFSHDSIDSISYDWERVGNPNIAPKHPFKIYLPQTTEDVVATIKEVRTLGQELVIRANGHSSNHLVTKEGGVVLCTQRLNRVLEVNTAGESVTVQPGIPLAEVDAHLRSFKYGLPVIGDHAHVTAGGFASVGGISPASHRYGMFVDNVLEIEYVTTEGEVMRCSKTSDPARFHRILGGLGKYGIITQLKLRIVPGDKYTTLLENDYRFFTDLHAFLEHSGAKIRHPGDALMERGLWVDFPLSTGSVLTVGQFSAYHKTQSSPFKVAREKLEYGYLGLLGRYAGRLPAESLEMLVKYLGIAGIVLSPKYATIKNIENFTDRILDETTGDPTRMFIALAPLDRYETLFRALYQRLLSYRATTKCFTFVSIYVKAISSAYLTSIDGKQHAELMLFVGLNPDRMTPEVLESFVSEMDDLCIQHGAFRYMHSRTVQDAERRAHIDPNECRARKVRGQAAEVVSGLVAEE